MEDVGKTLTSMINQRNYRERYDEMMTTVLNDEEVAQFLAKHADALTEQDIQRSYANLYEFVQERRKFALNDSTMIAPGYEPQLVLNSHTIEVTYVPTEALIATREAEAIRSRIHAIDMPKDLAEANFADYEQTAGRTEALFASLDFIDAYLSNPKAYNQASYFSGSFGIGKTYLLGAIARRLAEEGYTSTLIHFPTFAVEMKQAIGKDLVGEKLTKIKRAPILMIDDIGADALSSWIRDDILGVILQYRMQEQLPTFFTSNFTLNELDAHLSVTQRGEEEPLKAKRIMERIRFLAKEVPMTGMNRRQQVNN